MALKNAFDGSKKSWLSLERKKLIVNVHTDGILPLHAHTVSPMCVVRISVYLHRGRRQEGRGGTCPPKIRAKIFFWAIIT